MTHERFALSGSITAAIVGSALILTVGCGSRSNITTTNEPTFSRLAGRWSVSLYELLRSMSLSEPDEPPPSDWGGPVVLLTFHPDGSVDWSRSHYGAMYGLHGLRQVGDQCVGNRYEAGRFEVVACDYTPTRSFVEIRGLSRDEVAQELDYAKFEIELQADDTVIARISTDTISGWINSRPELPPDHDNNEFRLRRHDPARRIIQNDSRLNGQWSLPGSLEEVILVIRGDGSFDWTGTMEGLAAGLYQLEFPGDRSFDLLTGEESELLKASHEPTMSHITFRRKNSGNGDIQYRLTARLIDPDLIEVSIQGKQPWKRVERIVRRLVRNDDCTLRDEIPLSTLSMVGRQEPVTLEVMP